MKILEKVQKVPAGILLVPTIIGAAVHTFCPDILKIGDPTNIMFTSKGMIAFIGLMLFFTGTQLKVSDFKTVVKRGFSLCVFKYILSYGISFIFLKVFGLNGFLGISFLAFASAFTSSNGALYMGIIQPYGDEIDYATFGILMMCSMPVLPMIFLNSANGGKVDYTSIISLLVPFIFGLVLGNLDNGFKKMFSQGNAIILPFIGFQFGSSINLLAAAKQIPTGILLTVLFYAISLAPLFLFDRCILKQKGYASLASVSVAGVALAMPTLAAKASGIYAPYVDSAISQIALIMFITTFATPFITEFAMKKLKVEKRTAE